MIVDHVWGKNRNAKLRSTDSEAYFDPLLALKVAKLHVLFAPSLLGEKRAERVKLGLGWVLVPGDVHFVIAAVDEVGCDDVGGAVCSGGADETQTHVALQRVAVGTAGGHAHQLAVTVNGFAPPRPQVQLGVVILQDQHDEAARQSFLPLLQQSLPAQEICVLERRNKERGE